MSTKARQSKEKVQHDSAVSPELEATGVPHLLSVSTPAACTNGQDRSSANSSCRDSDGDSSIADDSLSSTPTRHKFKVPSQRPRTSKSEKRRVSSATFSHEHSRVMELEREMRKLLSERNQLSKQLYSSKQDNTKLEGKVQVAVRDKSALLSQMASLSKDNRDLFRGKKILLAKAFSSVDVRKTRSLQQSLKQANREKRAKQKELEKLNIQMNMSSKQMQEKLLASLDEREEMETRIEDLECELQHLTECNTACEETNTVLKASLVAQEEADQALSDQVAQLTLSCQEKESELCGVRETLGSLAEEGDHLKHTLHTAQDNVSALELRVEGAEKTLLKCSQLNSELTQQLQSVQSEVEAERGQREGVETELSHVREQLRERDVQIEQVQTEEAEKESELCGVRETLGSLTEEGDRLKQTLHTAQDNITELEQKISSLEQNVSDSSQNITSLQTQLQSSQSEVEAERRGRELAEAELSQSRVRLCEVELSVASLEQSLSESSKENASLRAQLESVESELEVERGQRKEAETQLTQSRTQLSQEKTEMERVKSGHEDTLRSTHAICSGLNSELEKAMRDSKEAQALLQSQLAALEAERQEALRTAEEVKEKEAASTSQVQQLKKTNKVLQASQSSVEEQLVQAQEKLAALEEQVDGSAEVVAKEVAAAVQEQMTRELQEVQSRLSQQETHSTKVRSGMSRKVQDLEDELKKMQLEREQLEVAYLDLQEKCRPFQDQIEGLADVNALLQSQAALAKKEAQAASDQFASLVGHQNSRQKIRYVKKIRDENTAMKMELSQLHMEIFKLKKQIRRLQLENKAGPSSAQSNPVKPLSSKN